MLPILEMADPYYPHSHLATSPFSGYYMLFFMYSIYFIVVYPVLNYLHGEDLFGMAILTVVETNILWDFLSVLLFIFLSLVLIQISHMHIFSSLIFQLALISGTFVGSGLLIANAYQLYFTDRIFIIVLSWSFFVKTVSFILDKRAASGNEKPEWV